MGKRFQTLGSAALSSVTNAGVTLAAVAILSPIDYGLFATGMMAAILSALTINSFTGELLLTLPNRPEEVILARMVTWMITGALAVCILIVCAVLYVNHFAALGATSLAIAWCIPGATSHAVARNCSFSLRRPEVSFALDLIWAVLAFSSIAIAFIVPYDISGPLLLAVWGLGAYVSLFLVHMPRRPKFPVGSAWRWLQANWRFGGTLAYGNISQTGSRQIVALMVGGVVGLATLGSFRFAQTLLGLSTIFFAAARSYYMPRLSAARTADKSQALLLWKISSWLAVIPMLGAAVGSLLIARSGTVQGNQTVMGANDFLWPLAIASAGLAISQGPMMGLKVRHASGALLFARTAMMVLSIGGAIVGIALSGASGAAWSLAVTSMLGAVLWWSMYLADQER